MGSACVRPVFPRQMRSGWATMGDEQQELSAGDKPLGARERLLDAAGREFETKGYGGASVNRIIDAAGATKGGFYHYFSSKEDLAGILLRETLDFNLPSQNLVMQEIVDTGMILAHRLPREPALRAALR